METSRVPFLSADYFALADALPELAQAFALGPRVIAIAAGVAYEVVAVDEPGDPVEIPPAATTEPETILPELDRPPAPDPIEPGGFAPTCPGLGLAFGLAAIPLVRRRLK
jgi:hypothetical protein